MIKRIAIILAAVAMAIITMTQMTPDTAGAQSAHTPIAMWQYKTGQQQPVQGK
jgi:hypothetical protein